MELLSAWRKARVKMRNWSTLLLLKVLFQGWCSTLAVVAYREARNGEVQQRKVALDWQTELAAYA